MSMALFQFLYASVQNSRPNNCVEKALAEKYVGNLLDASKDKNA
jgi:hypothetical protein